MRAIITNAAIALLRLISLLPLSVFYFIADGLTLLNKTIIGYRKEVIAKNIRNSFPNASTEYIANIKNKFTHYFSDFIVESIKAFALSEEELEKRVTFSNLDVIRKHTEANQPVIAIFGHYGNWELCALGTCQIKDINIFALFREQKNEIVNRFIKANRQRYGLNLVSDKHSQKKLHEVLTAKAPNMLVFVADQAVNPNRGFWFNFLNQKATFVRGPEYYAKKYNCPVVFGAITYVKQGHYNVSFQPITSEPKQTQEGEIMHSFAQLLEKQINAEPAYWLWSHRRFRYQYKDWVNQQQSKGQ